LLSQRAVFLLAIAVKQAAAATTTCSNIVEKQSRAVQLLLHGEAQRQVVDMLSKPTAAAEFISISNVPGQVATALLQAGMRYTYDQLMQAVRARTAGVEVWVPCDMATVLEAGLPAWVDVMLRRPHLLVS
jgi:hypothetical protein